MARTITPKGFPAPLGMYSHGMVAAGGELVLVAGQVGIGPQGVAGPDVGSQTRQAFDNVRAIVEAAGCTMADVVRLQTFLVSADDIPGFMKARQDAFPEYFPTGVYPPNTLLVVSRLVRPELRVEVEAMAVRRPSRPPARKRPAIAKRARAQRRK
ncbi:MAG TPA: RidA family protein [Patescibacteria group bacterium]|nr:RidA family protein [Patescibacteria group bacterium]